VNLTDLTPDKEKLQAAVNAVMNFGDPQNAGSIFTNLEACGLLRRILPNGVMALACLAMPPVSETVQRPMLGRQANDVEGSRRGLFKPLKAKRICFI
jgi:hypothetical protein